MEGDRRNLGAEFPSEALGVGALTRYVMSVAQFVKTAWAASSGSVWVPSETSVNVSAYLRDSARIDSKSPMKECDSGSQRRPFFMANAVIMMTGVSGISWLQ